MKVAFDPTVEISDPKVLIGRDIVFKQLIALANRNSTVQLVCLRRFGKTSILKCLETHFRTNFESHIYPLFVDFKEVGSQVSGTSNVYRYLTAVLISRLTSDKIFTDPEKFRDQTIEPSIYWEDVFIKLQEIDKVRMPGLFTEIVNNPGILTLSISCNFINKSSQYIEGSIV